MMLALALSASSLGMLGSVEQWRPRCDSPADSNLYSLTKSADSNRAQDAPKWKMEKLSLIL